MQFLKAFLLGVMLPALLGLFLWAWHLDVATAEALRNHHADMLSDLEDNLQEPLHFFLPDTAARQVRLLAQEPAVYSIRVYSTVFDMDLARFERTDAGDSPIWFVRRHIFDNGEVLGFVELAFSSRHLRMLTWNGQVSAACAMAGVAFVSGVLLYLLYRNHVVLPLAHLKRLTDRLAAGTLGQAVTPETPAACGGLNDLYADVEELRLELLHARLQVEMLTVRDAQTSLLFREPFMERSMRELDLAERYGTPLSLVLAAFDSESSDMPTRGRHHVQLVETISRLLRPMDIMGHWDARVYAILLPECTQTQAVDMANVWRAAVNSTFAERGLTCSFGVAGFTNTPSLSFMHEQAERVLFHAMNEGGNRVRSV